jgi:uncharacterized protein YgiM (DUF1202 family)
MGAAMTKRSWIGAGLALLLGGSAIALSAGDTVYVRVKNTRIFKKPDPTADQAGAVQPGAALIWNGKVKNAALPWQQVTYNGKKAYVLGSNLSLTKPSEELVASQGAGHLDTSEMASSGDAVKALGEGAKAYGQELKADEVVKQIEALEATGKDTPPKLEAFEKQRNLTVQAFDKEAQR